MGFTSPFDWIGGLRNRDRLDFNYQFRYILFKLCHMNLGFLKCLITSFVKSMLNDIYLTMNSSWLINMVQKRPFPIRIWSCISVLYSLFFSSDLFCFLSNCCDFCCFLWFCFWIVYNCYPTRFVEFKILATSCKFQILLWVFILSFGSFCCLFVHYRCNVWTHNWEADTWCLNS